ncbi:YfjI family protein [Klebsiella michiganensis]|uniref:YfjI family protein n=1 Tax=Klebsiella michiganensis TaxID=1134687 RepID=UPI003982BD47
MNDIYETINKIDNANKKRENQSGYPVDKFPPVMSELIDTLHDDSQIPMEIIGNAVLAAASMACQSLVDLELSHNTTPELCSLYLLTLAESGEGKTTINKQVMAPFYEFMDELYADYEHRLSKYKGEVELWRIKKKVLEREVSSAYKHPDEEEGESVEEKEKKVRLHIDNEPQKPKRLTLIYEDTTLKALTDGMDVCSHGGLISDEAIIFFKGYTNDKFGILNKGWEGGVYAHKRADGTDTLIKPCLTVSLMTQPRVAKDYFRKGEGIAKDVGFLARFLFSEAKSTIGNRTDNTDFSRSRKCLNIFHDRIRALLSQQKEYITSNKFSKKTLTLSAKALAVKKQFGNEINDKIGLESSHIKEILSKSGTNAARIAAIFHCFNDNCNNEISPEQMTDACDIMRWYNEQAQKLFYFTSENYQFEIDVKEVYFWVKDKFTKNGFAPIEFNTLRQGTINRFRNSKKLKEIFDQLVAQDCIVYARTRAAGCEYVLPVISSKYITMSYPNFYVNAPGFIKAQSVIQLSSNVFVPAQPEPGTGNITLNTPFSEFKTSKDIQGKLPHVNLNDT